MVEISCRVFRIRLQEFVEFVDRILQVAGLHVLHGEPVTCEAVIGICGNHAAENVHPVIRHACATIPAKWPVLSLIPRLLFRGRPGPIRLEWYWAIPTSG